MLLLSSYLPTESDYNLLSPFAFRLSSFFFSSLTHLNHISLSRLCTEKGQTFPPIFFSHWCESQTPFSIWNGSWSKTAANQGKKVEQDPFLLDAQADLTLCSMNEEIASYKILDMHSNTNTFSYPVKPSELYIFDSEYMYLKVICISAHHKLLNTCLSLVLLIGLIDISFYSISLLFLSLFWVCAEVDIYKCNPPQVTALKSLFCTARKITILITDKQLDTTSSEVCYHTYFIRLWHFSSQAWDV